MKKIFTLLIGIVFSLTILNAQDAPPQAFSFKAMIKDNKSSPVVLKTVSLRISIIKGELNGLPIYVETFRPTTNVYAQVDVEIGRGMVVSGIFSAINWAIDEYFITVEVDVKGGNNYTEISRSQLLSVPYALYAGNLSGGQDNDDDPLNELISNAYLSGTTLYIVEGNETTIVELSGILNGVDVSSTNEIQNLQISGHELSIQGGNTITLPNETGDADADPLNEIQALSLEGNILKLTTNGSPIEINLTPFLDNTDSQTLELAGRNLTIQNGNTVLLPEEVNDADTDPLNEIQVLSLDGNILTLSTNGTPIQIDLTPFKDNTDNQTLTVADHKLNITNGNTIDLPDNVDDADSDPANEIQVLSLEGDIISLSREGGTVVLPVANTVNGLFYYGDKDHDSYGDQYKALWIPVNVSPPAGYVATSTDCDDNKPSINPGANDNCDGFDNDCDGEIDEDCQSFECYQTLIEIFACVEESGCQEDDYACKYMHCMAFFEQLSGCEDEECIVSVMMNPGELPLNGSNEEKAAYVIAQCTSPDVDKDGFSLNEGDCNDSDPTINPGAVDIPDDGIDQNCNGRDGILGDIDDDGYTETTGDCDDNDASVYPGATDYCDNKDNDCDNTIDEDGEWATYYMDMDHDGYGGQEFSESFCGGGDVPDDFVPNNEDCNDHDPETNPSATERDMSVCDDGIDQDCNGSDLPCTAVTDDDKDGYSEVNGDCNDADNTIYPGAEDVCGDDIDQDCSGRNKICGDNDDDGYTQETGDCDDNDPTVYPGAEEICGDGIDQNCDGIPDEGCCMASLVQLLSCAEDRGCGLTDMSCLMQCTEGEFYFQECISLECIGNLLSEGLPFDETWTVNAKAEYFLSHCGTIDNDGDGFIGLEGDCDDTDPAINPGAEEICGDGIDQNCDGVDPPSGSCVDNDVDGFTELHGDCNDADPTIYPGATEICGDLIDQNCSGEDASCNDRDEDGYAIPEDCDDNDPSVYPGAEESCDGVDNNCDGEVDEFLNTTLYLDADRDGWGNTEVSVASCDDLDGYTRQGGDCNDNDPDIHPYATEICDNETDEDCSGLDQLCSDLSDDDGDGFSEVNGDCNDADPLINPGAEEICDNGIDEDCNGSVVLCSDLEDDDGDHFSEVDGDCDDTDPNVNPAAEEICDGKDNNCDGVIDEGVGIWYRDNDGDGYGNYENWIKSCDQQAGYVLVGGDCNDSNFGIYPNATDICGDGIDQNCTGSDAPCDDLDEDGYAFPEDCNDNDPNINPEAEEICDGIDNNCDANIDESAPMWYRDMDGDGYGGMDEPIQSCEPMNGYMENGNDCDDFDDSVNPGAEEICGDEIDQNCDGMTEPCPPEETDDDYDGYTEMQGDCNDANASVNPEAPEVPDFIDNDCDGTIDEGTVYFDDDGDSYTEDNGDCDDANATVYPGALEIADGLDNDCDGVVDNNTDSFDDDNDGFAENQGDCNDKNATVYPGALEIADGFDNDCDGTIDEGTEYFDDDGDGYTENQNDCNDADASIHPYATEICGDGTDQDCIDGDQICPEDIDDDGDGLTERMGDCNDTNPSVYPGALEICGDGIDQDCNYSDVSCLDVDNDGDGFTENQGDCIDTDATIYQGATEICGDNVDQDCNGSDISCSDVDNDGDYWTENQGDCDDNNPAVHPGAIELCSNGLDDDCTGGDLVCDAYINSVAPASLTLSVGTQGMVYVILAAPAGPSGVVVSVSSTSSCLYVPSILTIPPGQTNAGVAVNALCGGSGAIVFTLGPQQINVPITVIL